MNKYLWPSDFKEGHLEFDTILVEFDINEIIQVTCKSAST